MIEKTQKRTNCCCEKKNQCWCKAEASPITWRPSWVDSQLPSLISLFIFVWSISEANPKNNWMRGEQACLILRTNSGHLHLLISTLQHEITIVLTSQWRKRKRFGTKTYWRTVVVTFFPSTSGFSCGVTLCIETQTHRETEISFRR